MELIMVKQISVFLENSKGRLADVTKALGDSNINIRALSIADTTNFGILRLIVDNPDLAQTVLKDSGFTVSITDVMAIGIVDKPGSLSKALNILNDKNIAIEYMYAFYGKYDDMPLVILKVSDSSAAIKAFDENSIAVIKAQSVYSL
jgi:hypothetical protein